MAKPNMFGIIGEVRAVNVSSPSTLTIDVCIKLKSTVLNASKGQKEARYGSYFTIK